MGIGATHISPVVLRQEVGRRIRLAMHEAEHPLELDAVVLDFPSPGQPSICQAFHALGDERQDKSEHVEPARLRFAHL